MANLKELLEVLSDELYDIKNSKLSSFTKTEDLPPNVTKISIVKNLDSYIGDVYFNMDCMDVEKLKEFVDEEFSNQYKTNMSVNKINDKEVKSLYVVTKKKLLGLIREPILYVQSNRIYLPEFEKAVSILKKYSELS